MLANTVITETCTLLMVVISPAKGRCRVGVSCAHEHCAYKYRGKLRDDVTGSKQRGRKEGRKEGRAL